jgi:hypothetical protein
MAEIDRRLAGIDYISTPRRAIEGALGVAPLWGGPQFGKRQIWTNYRDRAGFNC